MPPVNTLKIDHSLLGRVKISLLRAGIFDDDGAPVKRESSDNPNIGRPPLAPSAAIWAFSPPLALSRRFGEPQGSEIFDAIDVNNIGQLRIADDIKPLAI